jgi:hypothetical protein
VLVGGALPARFAHGLAVIGGAAEWAVRPGKRRRLALNLAHTVGGSARDSAYHGEPVGEPGGQRPADQHGRVDHERGGAVRENAASRGRSRTHLPVGRDAPPLGHERARRPRSEAQGAGRARARLPRAEGVPLHDG